MKTLLKLVFGIAYIGMLVCTGAAFSYSAIVGAVMVLFDYGVWKFMRYMWRDGMINPITGEKLE